MDLILIPTGTYTKGSNLPALLLPQQCSVTPAPVSELNRTERKGVYKMKQREANCGRVYLLSPFDVKTTSFPPILYM